MPLTRKGFPLMLTFDLDAETMWTARDPANAKRPILMSQGRYGWKVGMPRILKLLERYGVHCTFFIPGQVAEAHPDLVREVVARGHEVAHHSYSHRWIVNLTPEEEREEMRRGMEVLRSITGRDPRGWRSPAAEFSDITLDLIQDRYNSPAARALYCSVDPDVHHPGRQEPRWDLGYLGTYSQDRQPPLERLLCAPAVEWSEGRFVVAGPQYPETISWPANVARVEHLPPEDHGGFYTAQRFTLNVTRRDMVKAGYSPSVRLFEAAACAVPIISDCWDGIETIFTPGEEIFLASSGEQVLKLLRDLPEDERRAVGERARQKTLASHTAARRAEELERYLKEAGAAYCRKRTSSYRPMNLQAGL